MSAPITRPVDREHREYNDKLAAWHRSACEWLGLDLSRVFTGVEIREGLCTQVTVQSNEGLDWDRSRVAHHSWSFAGYADEHVHTFLLFLDYEQSKAMADHIGPRPRAPWEDRHSAPVDLSICPECHERVRRVAGVFDDSTPAASTATALAPPRALEGMATLTMHPCGHQTRRQVKVYL